MTQPETESEVVASTATGIAKYLLTLQPGPLAELRRMTSADPVPAFWRLAARHRKVDRNPKPWVAIVQALAILAPKGDPSKRSQVFHNGKRPFGAVLCDGGDPGWPGKGPPRPALSEVRLMRLLASRGDQRHDAVVRASRGLARTLSLKEGGGIDVIGLAWACLGPERTNGAVRTDRIARDYYTRLDRADRMSR